MPGWTTTSDANLDHLTKVARDRSLHDKLYFLHFVMILKKSIVLLLLSILCSNHYRFISVKN